jgi:hypothetical protein
MGCDAATEFHIATIENQNNNIFYAMEDSDFCCRACCQAIHPFRMTMYYGGQGNGGPVVATYEHPLACHGNSMKCCCYQQINVFNPNGNQPIGQVREAFYFCVPTYNSFSYYSSSYLC